MDVSPHKSSPPGAHLPKAQLFCELGYGGDLQRYEALLQEAGLSHPRKSNLAASKATAVAELLRGRFFKVCTRPECRQEAEATAQRQGRQVVPAAAPPACEVCGGSPNQKAVEAMITACRARGWRRLCVVGGSPVARRELEALVAGRLELRLVDGTRARTDKEARADLAWSDGVVLWGSTQLGHRVSNLYSGPRVIQIARRSLAELARQVLLAAQRR